MLIQDSTKKMDMAKIGKNLEDGEVLQKFEANGGLYDVNESPLQMFSWA